MLNIMTDWWHMKETISKNAMKKTAHFGIGQKNVVGERNMTQLNLFDYAKKLKPLEPPCYGCVFAIKRGHFRLCAIGKSGYKKIGVWEFCKDRKEKENE